MQESSKTEGNGVWERKRKQKRKEKHQTLNLKMGLTYIPQNGFVLKKTTKYRER